jgi:hypothetical protein
MLNFPCSKHHNNKYESFISQFSTLTREICNIQIRQKARNTVLKFPTDWSV